MGRKRVELTPAQKKEADYERFVALYETGMSNAEIADKLQRPRSTIYRWEKKYRTSDDGKDIETKRNDRKTRLIDDAWEGLDDLLHAAKVRAAQLYESELKAKEILEKLCKDDLDEEVRKRLTEQLSSLKTASVGDLTALINTLYDKQAAASGESVTDNKIEIVINGWKETWDD